MTKDKALDLALEALEYIENNYMSLPKSGSEAITAIKQARSAPVQEPVAFNAGVPPLYPEMKDGETISVEYTTPPAQRQWVGLTDEAIWSEYQTLWPFHPAEEPGLAKDIAKFARAIEAKLKEKNT